MRAKNEEPAAWSMAEGVTLADFAAQGAGVQGLVHTLDNGSFVHAYLISGMEGVGKRTLAHLVTQFLLCTAGQDEGLLGGFDLPPVKKPCGCCPGCMQVNGGNHPDVVTLRPGQPIAPHVDKGKQVIPVDDIREVVRITGTHTYEGGCRVVRIEQADKMNQQAQNCLLKTLEEPTEGTVFLLETDSPSLLLPTIISRCRHIKLHGWDDDTIRRVMQSRQVPQDRMAEALRVSGGSIGRALAVADDESYWQRRSDVMHDFFATESRTEIFRISAAWKDRKEQAAALLDDVEDMLHTLLMVRLGRLPQTMAADYPEQWQHMAQKADNAVFARLFDAVTEARKMRMNQVTVQAVLERLLLCLMEEKTRW